MIDNLWSFELVHLQVNTYTHTRVWVFDLANYGETDALDIKRTSQWRWIYL